MSPAEHTAEYARQNSGRFLNALKEFIRFPSVSAQSAHAADMQSCAEWLAGHLQQAGLERSQVVPTAGHPLVYGEWRRALGRPTVLIYGHYDVQPAEPFAEWKSPPFEPVVRGDFIYGRGACDDKGQLMVHVNAIESWLESFGTLPVNVKCLFEGEEERGSQSLATFLRHHSSALTADAVLMSDMTMPRPHQPAITYSLRGALSLEIEIRGPRHDLHSGLYGGAVPNPLQELCRIIGRLHNAFGEISIPGFYDNVREWPDEERAYMAEVGPSDDEILRSAESPKGKGELDFTLYERTTIRPSLSVNGIVGGYQDEGAKAIIPSSAVAKLNLRLVPDQDPAEIERLLRNYVITVAPPQLPVEIRTAAQAAPALVNRGHPAVQAAREACLNGFGVPPVFLRSGGTIPVVSLFQQDLRTPVVMLGLALPDDALHGPNERFFLPNFFRGISTSIHFLANLRDLKKPNPAAHARRGGRNHNSLEEWLTYSK